MRRIIYNIISVTFSLVKFSLIKIFHWNTFKFHFIERFSPNTQVYFMGNGKICLARYVTAHTNTKLIVGNNAQLIIDENARFNYGCIITAKNYIYIGKGVGFGPNVLIYDHDHDFRAPGGKRKNFKKGTVTIGENSIIGACSFITSDIPDNTMAFGVPARVVRSI